MNKISISELAQGIVERYGLEKNEAETFVITIFDTLNEGLHNEKQVKIKGLGTFKVSSISARESVDVNTGERIVIDGRDKISFTPETSMRDLVNRPFGQFETVVLNDDVDFSKIDKDFQESQESQAMMVGQSDVSEFIVSDSVSSNNCDIANAEDTLDKEKNHNGIDSNHIVSPDKQTQQYSSTLNVSDDITIQTSDDLDYNSRETEIIEHSDSIYENENKNEVVDIDVDNELKQDNVENAVNDCRAIDSADSNVENSIVDVSSSDETERKQSNIAVESDADDGKQSRVQMVSEKVPNDYDALLEKFNNENAFLIGVHEKMSTVTKQLQIDKDKLNAELRRTRKFIRLLIFLLVIILLCCLGSVGFMYKFFVVQQKHIQLAPITMNNNPYKSAKIKPRTTKIDTQSTKIDSVKIISDNNSHSVNTDIDNITNKEVDKKLKEKKNTIVSNTASESYNKDPRIRTGAYSIVGIDRVVTAKSGQTLHSIGRSFLGNGMECYIEAVNMGVSDIKVGQKINIPKLKLKKK